MISLRALLIFSNKSLQYHDENESKQTQSPFKHFQFLIIKACNGEDERLQSGVFDRQTERERGA